MTQLLISVRNSAEAQIVSQFPIAILDVKEPEFGALGAASAKTLESIASTVGPSVIKSFSAGELVDQLHSNQGFETLVPLVEQFDSSLLSHFSYVKIGLSGRAGQNWQTAWRSFFQEAVTLTQPVAVAYLDFEAAKSPCPDEILRFSIDQENCSTLLLDTFTKKNSLFHWITENELAQLVLAAKRNGIRTVVAGSVNKSCLSQVLATQPDFIGIRGAVCRGDRAEMIDEALVEQWTRSFESMSIEL